MADSVIVFLYPAGLPLAEDIKNLATCKVAVGTPGRLKYLIKSGHLDCTNARLLVLDEADLLFSGGGATESTDTELLTGKNTFPAAINFIWWSLPDAKQVLALSATYTQHLVEQHLPRYLRSPVLVRVSSDDPSLLGVRQYFRTVATSKSPSPAAVFMAKVKELQRMLKEIDFRQCLVFSNFHNRYANNPNPPPLIHTTSSLHLILCSDLSEVRALLRSHEISKMALKQQRQLGADGLAVVALGRNYCDLGSIPCQRDIHSVPGRTGGSVVEYRARVQVCVQARVRLSEGMRSPSKCLNLPISFAPRKCPLTEPSAFEDKPYRLLWCIGLTHGTPTRARNRRRTTPSPPPSLCANLLDRL